jgi:hypothetical protein
MRRLVVPALILMIAFFAFPKLYGKSDWFTPMPSLQAMESQIKFNYARLVELIRFQRPSLSPFSIPYLTIMEVREEASTLQVHNTQ